MKKTLLFAASLTVVQSFAQVTLLPAGAVWKYNDQGLDLGSAWILPGYADAGWPSGNAELGYGDGDESTTVSYGSDGSHKHITTYFRKTVFIASPAAYTNMQLELVRDDGAVVYVNGVEVVRSNMPSGTIGYTTLSDGTIAWPSEDNWHVYNLSPLHFVAGNNVIAVEIHQDDESSSDISFNLRLIGLSTPIVANVTRGPYLQQATDHSIIVKWRTDMACDSKVNFGLSPTSLGMYASDPGFTTEHEVKLTGLDPHTQYYYSIAHSSAVLTPPSAAIHFLTAPLVGATGKYRFWAVGDAGSGNDNMRGVRSGFEGYNAGQQLDGWLWLGDNAYESGFDGDYQDNVFSNNTFEELLKQIVVWPAPGNHDYNNHIPFSPDPAYYDIFSLPTMGECGGLASGTEKYYSYNYGNIHFVVLDSYDEDRESTAPMATWLANDLAANTLPWVIAYWHHPPYTKGSHDSDNPFFIDSELPEIRENILPIIENYGVDLVLNGHSHSYERTYLLDGHYGSSGSFVPAYQVNASSGDCIIDCPYQKNTGITSSHNGTVYAVVGCSGKLDGTPASGWPHPAMSRYTESNMGSMLVEVEKNRLDAKFIKADSTVFDQFTIIKNAGTHQTLQACPGDNVVLHPSWPGTYVWQPSGFITDSLEVNALVNTVYYVTDSLDCIKDTFNIEILPSPPCAIITGITDALENNGQTKLFLGDFNQLIANFDNKNHLYADLRISNAGGKTVYNHRLDIQPGFNHFKTDLSGFTNGFYIVSLVLGTETKKQKIVISH